MEGTLHVIEQLGMAHKAALNEVQRLVIECERLAQRVAELEGDAGAST